MSCRNGFRSVIAVFVVGLGAVQAARSGSQAAAALTVTQTWGRKCTDSKGTLTDEQLRKYGVKKWYHRFPLVKRCYCYIDTFPPKIAGASLRKSSSGETCSGLSTLRRPAHGCRCLKGLGRAQELSELVTAAAVCFCAQVVEKRTEDLPQTYHHLVDYQWFIQNKLKVTPRLCQEILTGTLEDFGTSKSKEFFGEANGLPKHNGTKGAPGPLGHRRIAKLRELSHEAAQTRLS